MSGAEGTVSVRWLGQAGYAIEAPARELCLIDPYLSDYVEEDLGVPRVAAKILDPAETRATLLVATHWHHDHLDRPTCRELARANPELTFVGPRSTESRLRGWGIAPERIVSVARGESTSVGPFTVHALFARHDVPGWLAEDAIGVVIEVAGARIYHSGDTEYDSRCLEARRHWPLDAGFFVINGTGGNMNAREAALMAHEVGPRLAVPMHYGMWAPENYGPEATLDPAMFADYCARLGGPATTVLELGEALELRAAG